MSGTINLLSRFRAELYGKERSHITYCMGLRKLKISPGQFSFYPNGLSFHFLLAAQITRSQVFEVTIHEIKLIRRSISNLVRSTYTRAEDFWPHGLQKQQSQQPNTYVKRKPVTEGLTVHLKYKNSYKREVLPDNTIQQLERETI